jgi:splicing factor 3A subunit 2
MDMQNRVGSKPGAGGVASHQQEAIARRERLRQLAMETIDLSKDPYFMRNHLGTFECKLCLTLHPNEGNYLAHTQGKKHQTNLGRRAHKEAQEALANAPLMGTTKTAVRKGIKIGRPGYKVTKQQDPASGQYMLAFEIEYSQIQEGLQPRHRFMSAFEQRIEVADKAFQYIVFAAEPYETIAFKVPNIPVDKSEGKFSSTWNKEKKIFQLVVHFQAQTPSS